MNKPKFWLTGSVLLCVLFAGASQLLAEDETDRKLSPSDILIIEVFGEKEFSRELRVQKSGTITYPFLGNVEVAGKTTSEVEKLLETKLGEDYLVEPVVTVTVKEYRSRTVSVLGKVNREGAVELPAEYKIDIVEAIARAGGFAPTASERIELTRNGKTTVYRLNALRKIKDPEKRISVEPGDVIYVREAVF